MTRLINADKYKNHLVFYQWTLEKFYPNCQGLIARVIALVDDMETVDAVPVKHGKWIDMDEQSYTWKVRCSVCGHERSMLSTQGEYPNYCENCGARMDEE